MYVWTLQKLRTLFCELCYVYVLVIVETEWSKKTRSINVTLSYKQRCNLDSILIEVEVGIFKVVVEVEVAFLVSGYKCKII